MISPDLASAPPAPVRARGGGAPADDGGKPAPERAFEAFVAAESAEPADAAKPAGDTIDLVALLDAAASPAPVVPDAAVAMLQAVAPPLPAAAPAPPIADEGEPGDAKVPAPAHAQPELVLTPAPAAAPAAPSAAAPATVAQSLARIATLAAPAGGAAGQGAESPAEATVEPEAEQEAAARIPHAAAVAGPAAGGAEGRPMAAAPAQAGIDLAVQSASAQSWKLSAVSAEAAQAAREPAHAPSPRDVAGQITVAIAQSTQPQIDIRLDPPELGRVQIRLNPTEHGLQALVLADRPETQDFLRRHADQLVRDLTDAGYAQVTLDFAAGGEAAPRDAPDDERRFGASFEASSATPPPAREAPRRVAAGNLDIRL